MIERSNRDDGGGLLAGRVLVGDGARQWAVLSRSHPTVAVFQSFQPSGA